MLESKTFRVDFASGAAATVQASDPHAAHGLAQQLILQSMLPNAEACAFANILPLERIEELAANRNESWAS